MTRRRSLTAMAMAVVGLLAVTSVAEAATKTAFAGPPLDKPPAGAPRGLELNEFYRRQVTIHVGDTISWQIRGFHNVMFVPPGEQPPPFGIPDPSKPIAGSVDAAGAPFWFNGQPNILVNPAVAAPTPERTTDGTEYRNSGLPPLEGRPKPYKLKFTRAGTFKYLCAVHTPRMTGSVKVVPKGRKIPSAQADAAATRRQALRDVEHARRLSAYKPKGARIIAGHDRGGSALLRFFPAVKNVKVGETLELAIDSKTEAHTFSFGPRAYLMQAVRDLIKPVGPPPAGQPPTLALNPLVLFPSDPPPAPPLHTGTNHGNGFLNTGFVDGDSNTPFPVSTRVTFTAKGTFPYICLIHPNMVGKVNVR